MPQNKKTVYLAFILLLSLSLANAQNDPGHDTLYILRTGDSISGDYNFSNILFINETFGRVGIGTSTPASKLEVVGNISSYNNKYIYTGDTTTSGQQTPRCTCDTSTVDQDCSYEYFTNIDDGATCYDQYYQGFPVEDYESREYSRHRNGVYFGNNNTFGSGLVYDESQHALRAGLENMNSWTASPLAKGSIGLGSNINASGQNSFASGIYSTASGYASIALGFSTTASGARSTALGDRTTASGSTSTALGYITTASGAKSTALGHRTTASGDTSLAIGREIEAGGDYSVAIALNDQNGANVSQANTMAIMGGNVGIGVLSPTQALEINGGLRLNTSTSKPSCTSSVRGTFWFEQATSGNNDLIYSCMKNSSESYNWVQVAIGG